MDRVKLNIRANLNYALDKAEDPQKILDQFLLDMQENIQAFKESIVSAIADVKKLEREISVNSEKVSLWEERAMLALKKGNEELARKALDQKISYAERDRRYKEELEKQKQAVEELKASLPTLESKLEYLRGQKSELIRESARLKKEAIQSVANRTGEAKLGIDPGVFTIYDSMVDRVKSMEDYAEAISELYKSDELENKFRDMEKSAKIESELKAMKDSGLSS